MNREYQKKQLPIVLVPMAFTVVAIAVLRWLPDELMLTAAYPAVGWSVVGGNGLQCYCLGSVPGEGKQASAAKQGG